MIFGGFMTKLTNYHGKGLTQYMKKSTLSAAYIFI